MPIINVTELPVALVDSGSINNNPCNAPNPVTVNENQNFYIMQTSWQLEGAGCGFGGGSGPGVYTGTTSASLGNGDGRDMTGVILTSSFTEGKFSINKAGYYTVTIDYYSDQFEADQYWSGDVNVIAGESGSITGSLSHTGSLIISYQSASAMYYKDFYRDIAPNNATLDNGTYANVITGSQVPISGSAIPVQYTSVSTSTGSLAGMFSGSVYGRAQGYANGGTSQSYSTVFYANPFSGSFYGIITGSMCGDISGVGIVTGMLDAGTIAVASASINGGSFLPYSGSITGSISGSISGSIACGIVNEYEQLYPEDFLLLDDGRLRIYYTRVNYIQNQSQLNIIETTPIIGS